VTAPGNLRSAPFRLRIIVACVALALAFAPGSTLAGELISLEIASAHATLDQRAKVPVVTIKLSKSSARILGEFSSRNIGKMTEFRAAGQVLMKPVIREPLLGGSMQISGHFTVYQARDLVDRLNAGGRIEMETVGK
jgi:preprotein translocase subunit SecD